MKLSLLEYLVSQTLRLAITLSCQTCLWGCTIVHMNYTFSSILITSQTHYIISLYYRSDAFIMLESYQIIFDRWYLVFIQAAFNAFFSFKSSLILIKSTWNHIKCNLLLWRCPFCCHHEQPISPSSQDRTEIIGGIFTIFHFNLMPIHYSWVVQTKSIHHINEESQPKSKLYVPFSKC